MRKWIVIAAACCVGVAFGASDSVEEVAHGNREFWIAAGTVALAVITFGLAVVTGVLARYTYRLWDETKNLRIGADETAAKQAQLSGMQLDLAEKQHALQRLQFIATHRPKLIVRRITLDRVKGMRGDTFKIQFIVANIGGSQADKLSYAAGVWMRAVNNDDLPAILPYGDHQPTEVKLESGESMPFVFHLPANGIDQAIEIQFGWTSTGVPSDDDLLFFGQVAYEDAAGTRRQTAFLRRYDFNTRSFSVVESPDFEFQD